MQKYSYYPKARFKDFEKLVVAIADNKLKEKFWPEWKKFDKTNDPEIQTISYCLRKMVVKKNNAFHMDITTREYCKILEVVGVQWRLDGQKLKFTRTIQGFWRKKEYAFSVGFYGWTRTVQPKMARDIASNLDLLEEYPSFSSMADPDSSIYRLVKEFESPLRRLKDK